MLQLTFYLVLDALRKLGQYDEATHVYNQALGKSSFFLCLFFLSHFPKNKDIVRDVYGDSHSETAEILNGIGLVLKKQVHLFLHFFTFQFFLTLPKNKSCRGIMMAPLSTTQEPLK